MFSGIQQPYTACLCHHQAASCQQSDTIKTLAYVQVKRSEHRKSQLFMAERRKMRQNPIISVRFNSHNNLTSILSARTTSAFYYPVAMSDILTDAFGRKISYPSNEIYCLTVKANGDVAAGQGLIFFNFLTRSDF